MTHPVLILGGGIAGVTVARRLHDAGIDFRLIESRDRLGGRILSVGPDGLPSRDGFDLGPSWFWPDTQVQLGSLVSDLGLSVFPQSTDGDMAFERSLHEPARRFRGMGQEPQSMRVAGGTGAIVTEIAGTLPPAKIQLNCRITALEAANATVTAHYLKKDGSEGSVIGRFAVLALPPRLIASTIDFFPKQDQTVLQRWQTTPTWMAPHAKFFALYDRRFWKDAGLSGAAQSMVGPLVEIHDATTASGQAALFGFVGVPARERARLGQDLVVAAAIGQLQRLFGPDAGKPTATLYKDWAADALTATADDQTGGDHPMPDLRPWISGPWADLISLAGSETSETYPGYLAGAIDSALRVSSQLTGPLARPPCAAAPEENAVKLSAKIGDEI